MSSCTTTVQNSVRKSEPVGQTSRHAACVQCLQTSDSISQRSAVPPSPFACSGFCCSTNTLRHVAFAELEEALHSDYDGQTLLPSGVRFDPFHPSAPALPPMLAAVPA